MKCSIQLGFAIALINIHYLYNMCLKIEENFIRRAIAALDFQVPQPKQSLHPTQFD